MEDMNYEEMRNQMAMLREHLDKQEIVSDRLLRDAMKTKTKDIKYTKQMVYGAAAACIIIYPLTTLSHIWSWPFALATCAMMIFCVLATYYIHKPVERLNYMTDDLATVARVMARFKKQYDDWLHYVTPALLIPWFTWACYEIGWKNAPAGTNPWPIVIALLIGGCLGGVIGYLYHRKAVNAAQSVIDQINEQ